MKNMLWLQPLEGVPKLDAVVAMLLVTLAEQSELCLADSVTSPLQSITTLRICTIVVLNARAQAPCTSPAALVPAYIQ